MTSSPQTPEWSSRVREAFHSADLLGLVGHDRTVFALHRMTCNTCCSGLRGRLGGR